MIVALDERFKNAKDSIDAAITELEYWGAGTLTSVANWRALQDVSGLVERADRAAQYAKAAAQVGVTSIEAAEKAALDARLARTKANDAEATRGA